MGQTVKQFAHVRTDVDAFTFKVPLIEVQDLYIILRKLGIDIRVFEDESLIQSPQELLKDVLLHAQSHILPLQSRLLHIFPDLQVVVRGDPSEED